MARARHARGHRRRAVGLVAGGLLLMLTGGGLWAAERDPDPGRSATAPTPTAPPAASATPTSPETSPETSPAALPPALLACAGTVRAAEAAVGAAAAGADHWDAHVQAYRDLVRGRVGYATANKTWERTTKAGPGDRSRWRTTYRAYEESEDSCADVVGEAGAYAAVAEACTARAAAAGAAVAGGREILAQWAEHQEQMDQRRTGRLSDDEADARFLAAVRTAGEKLDSFHRDRDRLRDAPACDVPEA